MSFRHRVTRSFRHLSRLRSRVSPLPQCFLTLLYCSFGVELRHACRLVTAQCPQLSIGQTGVAALCVSTVAQPHEFNVRIDTGGRPDLVHRPEEVTLLPRQIHALKSVRVIPGNDQGSVLLASV
jgi:hypothetical protein